MTKIRWMPVVTSSGGIAASVAVVNSVASLTKRVLPASLKARKTTTQYRDGAPTEGGLHDSTTGLLADSVPPTNALLPFTIGRRTGEVSGSTTSTSVPVPNPRLREVSHRPPGKYVRAPLSTEKLTPYWMRASRMCSQL